MDTVRITEDNLEEVRDLLNANTADEFERGCTRGVAATRDDIPQGALVWEIKNADDEEAEPESELLWIDFDSREDGEALFESYRMLAGEEEVVRTFFELPLQGADLEKLLAEEGFAPKKAESRDILVTVSELSALDISKGKYPQYVSGIGSLMTRQFRRGIMNCLFQKRKGLLEDLGELPMSYFDEEVSSCVITDEKVNGFLLVHQRPDGVLIVELMAAFEPDSAINLAMMMRRSIQEAVRLYPADTKVLLRRHTDVARKLSGKLFPNKKGEQVLYGERKENA